MWLLLAEMALALSVIIFIFWWTMRARPDRLQAPPPELPDESPKGSPPEDSTKH